MQKITEQKIDHLLTEVKGKKIAIIGDLMIDRYVWGRVSRISPEAPVPVVEVETESVRLGGAANVANNITSLGGTAFLVGVVGDDHSGVELRHILETGKTTSEGIVVDPSRPTTVKTRVIAHDQHVVRIDSEEKRDVGPETVKNIFSILEKNIDTIDGIIIEDYNKGVVVTELIRRVIELANKTNPVITVDPKFNNFFEYKNVTVFKPNKKETEDALGRKLKTENDILEAGKILLEKLQAQSILLTRSENGMSIFQKNGNVIHIPTVARRIADVSGAGDTVIATLTAMLACGADIREAASIANFAGGIVCGEVGIVPIDPVVLRSTILR
jgi:D-glycero-beta-D-manno-heptose-7-phosphate kinase